MSQNYDAVSYRLESVGDGAQAAIVTLNRPERLNAIDWEMIRGFDGAVSRATNNDSVRALLITGSGRAFSAGGDLKSYVELQRDPVRFPRFVGDLHQAFGRLRSMDIPAVALVNGIAAAGGLELLLNCDLAMAAKSARIGDCHLNFGQMGGGGVLTLLPRLVGIQKAADLVLTGRFLTADEATEWGLISVAVPDDELLPRGLQFARDVASKSRLAVANAKFVMNTVWSESLSVRAGLALELERNARYCLTSLDAPEGLTAFSEKRKPRFTGK